MVEFIRKELSDHGIKDAAAVPLSLCKLLRPYKLERCGFKETSSLSVVIFTIPYLTDNKKKNISAYAIPRDYHLFCSQLFDAVIPRLKERFPHNSFVGFADNSPIDEVHAAALAGLGVIGENSLLITKEHSSYVFLGEIITDLDIPQKDNYVVENCEGCGRCASACPKGECGECLSAITQKKGELTEREISTIKKHGSAWGCDICSEVCPHTKRAKEDGTLFTDIPFFTTLLTPNLSRETIGNMSDDDFSSRAYSWRKRETILRNLSILENQN